MRRIILILLILLLLTSPAYARTLTISNGIVLENTKENATLIEKQIVYDLKTAPSELATKEDIGKGEIEGEYSVTPISSVLINKENPADRASYKAKYIAKYSNLVGNHKVYYEKDVVAITIYDVGYLPDKEYLQFNISATVNSIEKRVRNPYKIYNPPILVQISPDNELNNERGELVEDIDSAILESMAHVVKTLENGKATFGDGDPTLSVYASNASILTRAITKGESVAQISSGSGTSVTQYVSASASRTAGYSVLNSTNTVNNVSDMVRTGFFFNTTNASINYNAITSAKISLWGGSKADPLSTVGCSTISRFSPAGSIIGVAADYQTKNNTIVSSNITYASFSTTGYNDYTLNSQGYYGISNSSNSTFMLRTTLDLDATWNGTWTNYTSNYYGFYVYGPGYAGTSRDPVLIIVYSISPVASFSFTPSSSHTLPATVSFTDTSTNTPTSWMWYFGDGGTSTLQNPTHVYNTSGIFSPILVVTNIGGSDSETCTNCISMSNDITYNSTQTGQTAIDIPNSSGFVAWAPQLLNKSNSDFPIIGFAYSLGLPFTNAMGEVTGDESGWLFYYILWGILLIMIYRSSGSGVLAGLFGIVSGSAMSLLVGGEVITIATIFVIAIITGAIFTWGTKED